MGKRYFSSAKRQDLLWGSPSLLFNVYRRYFTGVRRSEREVHYSHLAPRLRISGAIRLLSITSPWLGQEQLYILWLLLCIAEYEFFF
jgi:hypothetical protein